MNVFLLASDMTTQMKQWALRAADTWAFTAAQCSLSEPMVFNFFKRGADEKDKVEIMKDQWRIIVKLTESLPSDIRQSRFISDN